MNLKKMVFTNGCFDILHRGHIDLLKEAKKLGDILIVAINTDDSVKKIKGNKRPIFPLKERIEVVDKVKYVDIVVPFHEKTPIKIIKEIQPNIHVKGEDYKSKEIPEKKYVLKYGGEMKLIKFKNDISTSKIIKKIVEMYKE